MESLEIISNEIQAGQDAILDNARSKIINIVLNLQKQLKKNYKKKGSNPSLIHLTGTYEENSYMIIYH